MAANLDASRVSVMTCVLESGKSCDALIIVDIQQDFLPGGALAIKGGDLVMEPLNGYLKRGGMWPAHCIAGTRGAAFSPQSVHHTRLPVAHAIRMGCSERGDWPVRALS